jgi:hypothetical protein
MKIYCSVLTEIKNYFLSFNNILNLFFTSNTFLFAFMFFLHIKLSCLFMCIFFLSALNKAVNYFCSL